MYELIQQGQVLQIKKITFDKEGDRRVEKTKRGKVTSFSRKSRKRIIELCNRLDLNKGKMIFVTLTFSSIPDHEEAYKSLRKFIERCRRRFKVVTAIWRKELQKRGSVHFHILFFNMPFWAQKDLQRVWTECTGEERSIVDIRLVRGKKHALRYVSKYIAKFGDVDAFSYLDTLPYLHEGEKPSTGRWWGFINKMLLPFAVLRSIRYADLDCLFYLKFTMRQLSWFRCSSKTLSAMLFHDECESLFDRFLELTGNIKLHNPQLLQQILRYG